MRLPTLCCASLFLYALYAQEEREPLRAPLPPRSTAPRPTSITIQGEVRSEKGEALPGAYVRVVGTVQGAVAGGDGRFKVTLLAPSDPIQLEASFIGYDPTTLSIPLSQADKKIILTLKETGVQVQEVVISASRVSETILESPVTVLKMTSRDIQDLPGISFFQNIPFLKGTEIVSSSLTFQVINTRGFNSTTNTRFVQRLDGVEMQAPALNFPIAMISNTGDLDVESIELLPGPASALYGPNAFSGILNVYSKDPFRFPGLSATVRLGVNHIDRRDTTPQPLYDVAIRYAHTWNNRLGIKIFANWMEAHDWIAQDETDMGFYAGARGRYAIPGPQNPGYDAVNRYGDEARVGPSTVRAIAMTLGPALGGGLPDDTTDLDFYLARTGYWEKEIIRYNARVAKASASLYYRLTDRLQLSYMGYISTGATVYQTANRYSLRDFLFGVNKIELSSPDFKVWAYVLSENSGNSFDSRFAALNLLNATKPHTNWMVQYVLSYTGQMYRIAQTLGANPESIGIPQGGDHAAARAFADSDRARQLMQPMRALGYPDQLVQLMEGSARPVPGTAPFRQALDAIIRIPNFSEGGAGFYDRSGLYHIEGQYDLTSRLRFVQLLVGGNYRLFRMNSRGTIFADTAGPIFVGEYGVFAQAQKPLFQERLRLLGSLRYDKNQNFAGQLTPRIGLLYAIDPRKNHSVRIAYQTGFRMPTLQAQYIHLDVGRFWYIGATQWFNDYYGIVGNNYSAESVRAFQDSLARRTRGSANPADYADLLRQMPVGIIRPEKVAAIELGSRHLLAERIYIDIDYAYSRFRDFLSTVDFVGPRRYLQSDGTWYIGQLTPDSIAVGAFTTYRRFFNATSVVYTHHLAIQLQYTISRQFFLNTNFAFAEIVLNEEAKLDRLIANFNTPRYRVGAFLTGRDLLRNRRGGFSISYRWVNAYLFEESFYERIIPTYQLVDLQLSYKFPKLRSLLRIGGQNILNFRHVQVPGGPTIGGLYYVQWVLDPFIQ